MLIHDTILKILSAGEWLTSNDVLSRQDSFGSAEIDFALRKMTSAGVIQRWSAGATDARYAKLGVSLMEPEPTPEPHLPIFSWRSDGCLQIEAADTAVLDSGDEGAIEHGEAVRLSRATVMALVEFLDSINLFPIR